MRAMHALRRAAVLATLAGGASLGAHGCKKSPPAADPVAAAATDAGREANPVAPGSPARAATAPAKDVLLGKDAPAGALALIGAPILSSPSFVSDVGLAGDLLLSCGSEHARLWEWRTGQLLWNHQVVDGGLRCALAPDGSRAAVTSRGPSGQTEVLVRDTKSGATAKNVTRGTVPWFSGDASRVVVAKGGVEVRDAATNKSTWNADTAGIAAGLDKAGALLVVEPTRVVRIASEGAAPQVVAALPSRVDAAAISRDGSAIAWSDGAATGVVDTATGAITKLTGDTGGKVKQLALTPGGTLIAVGIPGGLSVWDVKAGTRLWAIEPTIKALPPTLAFSSDGSLLAFNDVKSDLRVADARTGTVHLVPRRREFAGWTDSGDAVILDGTTRTALDLATGAESPAPAPVVTEGAPDWADEWVTGSNGITVGVSGNQALECAALKVWVAGGREQTLPKPTGCDPDGISPVWAIGPGIAVAQNSAAVEVWDVVAKKKLFSIGNNRRPLAMVAFAADGGTVLVVRGPAPPADDPADEYTGEARGGTLLEVWSVGEGKATSSFRIDATDVSTAAVSPDGRAVILGGRDGTVSVAAVPLTDAPRPIGRLPAMVTTLSMSPTRGRVAATDTDKTTLVFELP
jgi:WD40 repeat protein